MPCVLDGPFSKQVSGAMAEVELKAKPPAMLEKSPKGTVPVLVLADGTTFDESVDDALGPAPG